MAMSDYSLGDIAAVTGNGGGFGGNGWGNDGFWILVLLLFFGGNRGWGNGGSGYAGGDQLYPWLNQAQLTTQGFADQNAVMALNGIQSSVSNGFGNVATQLCDGFGGVQMALSNGFNGAEISANNRQMSNMQQMFGLSQQFDNCCCENRLGLANLNSTILSENCADRAAISDGIRDLLTAGVANTQRIVDNDNANYRQIYDWLCSKELRDEQRENDQLRQRITSLELAASQGAQTAQLLADNARQTTALEQYLNPTPIPAYVVQNPNCCQQWQGCGCNL